MTAHWDEPDDKEKVENYEKKLLFPAGLNHRNGVDVQLIDEDNFDENDQDDDRNFFKFRNKQLSFQRNSQIRQLSTELNVDESEVVGLLERSRTLLHDSLMKSKRDKHRRKGLHYLQSPRELILPTVAVK